MALNCAIEYRFGLVTATTMMETMCVVPTTSFTVTSSAMWALATAGSVTLLYGCVELSLVLNLLEVLLEME